MAKIVSYEGTGVPTIAGFSVYRLGDDLIVRRSSGFTSKGLQKKKQYANCARNASEFGGVSRVCKLLRGVLDGILPVHNRFAMMNAFTKKMFSLLAYDTENVKGKRNLATALQNPASKAVLCGYDFNPNGFFTLGFNLQNNHLLVTDLQYPKASKTYVGLRMLTLEIDFENESCALHVGSLQFFKRVHSPLPFALTEKTAITTTLIQLLELQTFIAQDGTFLPTHEAEKAIVVVGV